MAQFIGRQEMVWIAPARQRHRPGRRGRRGNGARPRVERWVEVRVREAYIHCRKHLPHLVKVTGEARPWVAE